MENNYIVEMHKIVKKFPGVLALDNVDLRIRKGQVHGLVGENGAGKSTLMKILSGIYKQDEGEIFVAGHNVSFKDAYEARKNSISLVHQEPQIVPSVSLAENVCLGGLPCGRVFINKKHLMQKSKMYCEYVGLKKPINMLAENLSIGEQQLLQFARALFYESKIIILDEPTASLTEKEKENIFEIIRKLQEDGVTFMYISHRVEELFEICDEITVLKDGKLVRTMLTNEIDKKGLVNLMVGREIGLHFPPKSECVGEEILRVEKITKKGVFENITFSVKKGEVLGIGGLIGAGRTEIMNSIFGMDNRDSGKIFMHGKEVNINSPQDAIRSNIAYVTEDRHGGMVLHMSIMENMTLPSLKMFLNGIFINDYTRSKTTEVFKNKLSIKTPSIKTIVDNLSGGNQQKVVFARWLMRNADLYILDEPTRGIDVGAKEEIYKIIRNLTNDGKAVIVISSELPELIGISDRILIIHDKTISGEINHMEATENLIMQYATGVINT